MTKKVLNALLPLTLLAILIVTRFINLGWGLPFPFHPDERNMTMAIIQLRCTSFPIDCFNPHFFAYGQLPLYIGYIVAKIIAFMQGAFKHPITFEQATLALRMISAVSSVITFYLLLKMVEVVAGAWKWPIPRIMYFLIGLTFIFSPALIQFAHFGTTESMLMLFYTAITYVSILLFQKKLQPQSGYILLSIILGLAVGTKVSSLVFILLPLYVLYKVETQNQTMRVGIFFTGMKLIFGTFLVSCLVSPYNFIDFEGFLGSMHYESAVGIGQDKVFYTRQFMGSIPGVFQIIKIFPFALGLPVVVLSFLGLIFLPWKKEFAILRLAIFSYFIFNAGLYAKWTRFMSPIFPLLIVLAIFLIIYIYTKLPKMWLLCVVIALMCLPGLAYVSVYMKPDVRVQATDWMVHHIPANSKVLQEGGNVVDLPLGPNNFLMANVDLYALEDNPDSKYSFSSGVQEADYILVPSRRVFANHTCLLPTDKQTRNLTYYSSHCAKLQLMYPALNQYYSDLFSGKLGFKEIATFTSYPTLSLFGQQILTFPDESAEETWSVFDHPVIRIYKKE